jgi:ribosome-associated toxin RatA of RatAB toxin-antitoxin module
MTSIRATRDKVVKIAHDAERFPEFVPNLVRYDVSKRKDGGLLLDYEIDVPMVNIEGQMNMDIGKNDQIEMTAVAGDIKRGQWLWTFQSLGPNLTVPINYSYTDVTDTSWFVRKLVEIQPLFEHGVVVASSTVQVRAIKERCEGRR